MALFGYVTRPIIAQTAPSIAGTWQGALQVDGGQRVVVKISKPAASGTDKPAWKAVYYNLDAHAEGLGKLATSITFEGQNLQFAVGSIDAAYAGKLSADGQSIAGTWTRTKLSHPLTLQRTTEDAAWELPGADQNMPKDASPEFEVATIKPTGPDQQGYTGFHQGPGRHISCNDQNVFSIIMFAYGVASKQIVGAPDWVGTEPYDIDGVADVPGQPNLNQMTGMFQKVMADRFHLILHHEKRVLSAYALTITKTGPKLAKSLGDPNGVPDETGEGDGLGVTMRYTNVSMQDFSTNMQAMGDGRPVVDQTGLTGRFDFTLRWNREQTSSIDPNAAPGLFTAMQEQLGLKLEPVKTPVDVIVIDHIERPSAN